VVTRLQAPPYDVLAPHLPSLVPIVLFRSVTNVFTVFSPRPNAARVAALSAREMDLAERAQRLEPKLTRRKRVEIECELAVVRRLLDQLGFRRSA